MIRKNSIRCMYLLAIVSDSADEICLHAINKGISVLVYQAKC